MAKETIYGDIRRIRKTLSADVDGKVTVSYPYLLQMFEAIESKAKELYDENERLRKLLLIEADYRCSNNYCASFRDGKCHANYKCSIKELRGMEDGKDIWSK